MIKFPEPTVLGQNYDGSDILAYTATDVAEYATTYTMALTRIIERKDADIEKLMERRDYWIDRATEFQVELRKLKHENDNSRKP